MNPHLVFAQFPACRTYTEADYYSFLILLLLCFLLFMQAVHFRRFDLQSIVQPIACNEEIFLIVVVPTGACSALPCLLATSLLTFSGMPMWHSMLMHLLRYLCLLKEKLEPPLTLLLDSRFITRYKTFH